MAGERWQFTQEDIENTPSRKAGLDFDKELNYRQQAANFLQDMGQRLQVPQLVINTAIVYMHRFYMFHSFTKFHRNSMVAACLFLAAKVEEQPRKLEHVLKVAHMCLHRDQKPLDTKSEVYLEQAQELVINENILLQTLGFDITVDHPHSHVVKTCTLVKATKDLAQTSYFLATNSLHLTNLCLQVNAKVVASVCIHLACKWANWEIPRSSEGKDWYQYVDSSITPDLLEDLTAQFVQILDKCPSKLKKKLMSHRSEDTSHPPPAPEKRQKSEPSAAAGSERSGQSSQSGSSVAASHTHTNHERKERAAQEPPSSSSSSSSKCQNPPSSSQSSRGKSSHTSGANVPESNPGLRRVKTESTALSAKEYMERKQREHLLAQHSKDRHSDAKRHSASAAKPDDRERHHTTSHRALEAPRPLIQEQQQAESLSQSSTDGKTSDNIDDAIERSMKEQPHNPNLALSDSSNAVPPNNSIPPEPAPVVKSRSDKRSHDSSRRSHEPKTRHNLEAKHHSKHREDKVNSPSVPPPAESSHKRERKNSSRSSKSPHKAKESRLSFTPEVTASPHSEMKLKIKLGVDPSMSSHKKEKEEKKLKIKSPAPPEKDSRSGSDSEKKDLKLKLNLKNVKPSAAGCDPSAAAAAEPYAPMKLVLSKDKVSGHYSSGHHKHRHSSSHHNSGDKRKRSHSPATTAEGHSSRHSHKMTRTSSASGVQQSGNGHHHGNNANNPSQVNVILQNIDQFIKVRSAEIQKQAQQQLNHNPPLPSDQPDLPPLPPSEPPPQPPLPHH